MHYTDGLESARLITRLITPDDIAIWTEYCSDPAATKYTAIPGLKPEEMARLVTEVTLRRYAENRLGLQALICRETNEFIGKCGLLIQDVEGRKEIEIGYHLLRRHWGKGYATEAAQLFRDYAFSSAESPGSLISMIHPDNIPSQKVALRNGMRHTENTLFKSAIHPALSREHYIFRITREEWEQQKKSE